MGRLDGKIVMITGAGSGIGRAATRMFAAEGARVLAAEIDPARGEASAAAARAAGGDAVFVQTDVTDDASVAAAVAAGVAAFGGLSVLFNCAGGSTGKDKPVVDVDLAVWEQTIALDLKGPFLCCRHAVPVIIAGGGGAVINMGSAVALRGNFPAHVYTAAKGGILSFTRALAGSYSRKGVRANAICPGLVMSERILARFEGAPGTDAAQMRAVDGGAMRRYPFGVGQPEDIANIALFLASDESRMINGAVIPAEGGMSAY